MKDAIEGHITLTAFDLKKDIYVRTDVSRIGLEFLILQQSKEKMDTTIIQVGSAGIKDKYRLHSSLELEAMAVHLALQKGDFFLRGSPVFTILLDCKSILRTQREIINMHNLYLQHMFIDLYEHRYKIIHVKC